MDKNEKSLLTQVLQRALPLLPETQTINWLEVHAASWREERLRGRFVTYASLDDIELEDLFHVDNQKADLTANTQQFLAGLPANNALLWGSRGTGKSSLIHALLNRFAGEGLRLIEVSKEDLHALPTIAEMVSSLPFKFVLFCDDLSFEADDPSYKALKSALEGSVFKASSNVLIYATSNRRHLVPEYMSDNQATRVVERELHESEVVEEKISLSDRFGLWLSFYPFKQDAYLEVVYHWVARLAARHDVEVDLQDDELRASALRWALARGVRSGRTAQYFARHWVGQKGLKS